MVNDYSLLKAATMGLLLLLAPTGLAEVRVLVLGDSLSDAYNMPREAGWVQRVDEALGDEVQMIDGSISGDTTSGALARLAALLDAHQPHALLVILGGNDGLRGLHPAQLQSNLSAIIEQAQAANARIALMQIRLPANLGRRYLEQFEGVYPQLADQYDIPLWPFFLEALVDQPGMMMDDGIHPSEQAQPVIEGMILPQLEQWLGDAR
ncbi:MAG: arylesterase [Pseudomonadota bacterium]